MRKVRHGGGEGVEGLGGTAPAASAAPCVGKALDTPSMGFRQADVDSDGVSGADSDVEVRRVKRLARRAKRLHDESQRKVDDALREKLRKIQRTVSSYDAENRTLREHLAEAQVENAATQKLLHDERVVVDVMTERLNDLRAEKLALEDRVSTLQNDVGIERRRAGRLSGIVDSIRQCSDDDLDSLIGESSAALSRMQRERTERVQTASRCVVCLDHKRALLLRPCNHMCLCEACGGVVQICPLCRQAITEKIIIHA